jgi:hypothetical protein
MPREGAGAYITTQLMMLRKPATVMLITAEGERRPRQMVDDVRLTVYSVGEIEGMNEREFTALAGSHDCILLTPRLGDGELFLRSLTEALNNHLGGAGARLILREIHETTPDPQINQAPLWENLAKTLGGGSDQLKDATMMRLRRALDRVKSR